METSMHYYGRWIVISLIAFIVSFAFLHATDYIVLSGLFFAAPITYGIYKRYNLLKGLEESFKLFLDDLRDLLQAGLSITSALQALSASHYGALSPYINRLTAQVSLGIPFERAMSTIFSEIKSPTVHKIVAVIIETQKAGGDIVRIFGTASEYVTKIERLKAERRVITMSTLFSSYLMFFIFLAIIIAIQVFFLPIMQTQTTIGEEEDEAATAPPVDFSSYFLYLVIVQSLFAGPMIGKMSDNNVFSGLKHSFILLVFSVTIYIVAMNILAPGTGAEVAVAAAAEPASLI